MSETVEQMLRFGPIITLAVTVAWLAAATRRTSASIGTRAYGFGTSFRQRSARLLFAGTITGALAGLGAHVTGATSWLLSPLAEEASVVRLAGMAVAIGGQALTLAARSDMGRRWRVGVPATPPDALVTTGLFALSRNPVFLGMLAMAAGLAIAVPSPTVIACVVAFWTACEIQVRDEERFLERAFGPAYTTCMRSVRRWI